MKEVRFRYFACCCLVGAGNYNYTCDQEKELLEPVVSHLQNYVSEPSDLRVPEKSAENAQEVSVATSLGTVVGLQEYGYRVFKGIPFAQPPVDDLRWASPQPAQAWSGDLNATEFSAACPQMQKSVNGTPFITTSMSEDCLYLNIWTPPTNKLENGKKVPVMVCDGLFWGDFLVNSTSDTIIVTTNYRLGALGFFATPELKGNYGFEDQQMALHWVQDHISAFGGDPTRVTIFGQSAGAMSVTLHTISPSSSGLFSRAIAESNPAGINYRTPEESYPYSEKVSGLLGCDYTDTDCLRSQSWQDIVDAQKRGYIVQLPLKTTEFLPYSPIIDGTIIPEQPMEIFRSGKVNSNIEAMVFGVTRNESLALFPKEIPINALVYNTMVRAFFAGNTSEVLREYPAFHNQSNLNQFSVLTTDWVFLCASRFAATAFANSNVPTYFYNFMHAPSNDPINYVRVPCEDAVCHSAELSFVRNSIDFVQPGSYTPPEEKLSWGFINYWRNFAHGDMGANQFGPAWPRYNATTDLSLDLDLEIGIFQNYHADECNFWDSLGY
eukprot:CAMPEP_0206190188 /NCGR_PEP_ID=MMETSP0166-20121206/4606_1 /ASSEMBLY_ACC=CAM_ASM_000260 /TAXON_ID=95228 /ORGANISM="Vannella robusta, Strain DIVA3 518/3/11/1/6" /LENGTH=550 /DNA_ID=CAMNT_0053606229 /DNA_START=517 /DNA_END=2166 /DNA_ORIENTATION=-